MEYDDFDAEYRRILDVAARLSDEALTAEVERLRGLASQLADPTDRRDADDDIASLAGVLSPTGVPPASPIVIEAERVHSAAGAPGGTPAERIARARAGMQEIGRLAATANPAERAGILELNESLLLLVTALESDTQ